VEVNKDTTLNAVGGDIKILGKITVKPGVTLTLSATASAGLGGLVNLGSGIYNGVTRLGVELQDDVTSATDMATLNITAETLTLDAGVTLNGSKVGQLVLQGGLLNPTVAKAAQLTALAAAMVDQSFATMTLGDAASALTLGNDSLLKEQVGAVTLMGTRVNLDDVVSGTANWTTNSATIKVLASGTAENDRDITVDVQLLSSKDTAMSLSSAKGNLTMTSGAKLASAGGNLALSAALNVVVAEVNASSGVTAASVGGVALDSTNGTILAASSTTGRVTAKTVSLYGNGPNVLKLATESAVKVEAQQMQVSAPSGAIVRDSGATGGTGGIGGTGETYYTLINRNSYFRQATVVGSAPSQVMVDKSQVGGTPEKALSKAVDGYKEYVALQNSGALYPAISSSRISQPLASGIMVAAARTLPMYSPAAGLALNSRNLITTDASNLLTDLSYGMGAHSQSTASDLINRPVNWSTGLPVGQNTLFIDDGVI